MAQIQNLSSVKSRVSAKMRSKVEKFTIGLKKAGLYLQAQSQKLVPVDYGVLKSTAFTRVENPNTPNVSVVVGYTANYAMYVHENLDAKHGAAFNSFYAKELKAAKKSKTKTGPFRHNRGANQQAKFLEAPFRRDKDILVEIVRDECRK